MNTLKPWASSRAPQLTRSLHQSTVLSESFKKRATRLIKAKNIAKQEANKSQQSSNKPHPVLGLEVGEKGAEAWKTTKLYHVLIKPEDLHSTTPSSPKPSTKAGGSQAGDAWEVRHHDPPKHLHFGLKPETAEHLLNTLPQLTVDQIKLSKSRPDAFGEMIDTTAASISDRPPAAFDSLIKTRTTPTYKPYNYTLPPAASEAAVATAAAQSEALSRIMDLKNASAGGISFVNRKRTIEAFADPSDGVERKGPDSGRPEVQAALLTMKIRHLWGHLTRNPKDITNRRSLRTLVHKRAKILKYLKGLDPVRYTSVLPDLGLDARAVEGEIIIR